MTDHAERIAVLETHSKHHEETLTDVVVQLEKLNTQVAMINSKFDKGTGFIAGVAFVFSLMGAVFSMLASSILKKLGLQ